MNKRTLLSLFIVVIVVIGIVLLTKHKDTSSAPNPATESQVVSASYANDDEIVTADFDTTAKTVTFVQSSVGTQTLPQVMSGSGARYANADESIVFWEHQGVATITKDGIQVFQGARIEDAADDTADEGAAGTIMPSLLQTWVWQKTDMNGSSTVPKKADVFTLTFSGENTVTGTTDCNGFSGTYHTDHGAMTFSQFASTLKFCDGSQETVFTRALSSVATYSFDESGNLMLSLADNAGSMYFKAK